MYAPPASSHPVVSLLSVSGLHATSPQFSVRPPHGTLWPETVAELDLFHKSSDKESSVNFANWLTLALCSAISNKSGKISQSELSYELFGNVAVTRGDVINCRKNW